MALAEEEVILPLPSPRSLVPRATHVRGAWLSSSVRTLRENGLLDAYLAKLPREHHETMTAPAAGEWYPIDLCMVHYTACDALDVPTQTLVDLGVEAVKYAHATFIGVAGKLTPGGQSPWVIFGQSLQRLWDRTFMGGGVGVMKLAEKEARIELVGWPPAGFRYTRVGMRGVLTSIAEFFCDKAYAREIESLCTPLTLGYRLAWV